MPLGFFAFDFREFSPKFAISNNFPGLRYMIFRKMNSFSRCVFAIFHGFSILERILARSRCIFRISLMKYRGFFKFSAIFADFDGCGSFFDAVLTRSRYAIGIFRVRFS